MADQAGLFSLLDFVGYPTGEPEVIPTGHGGFQFSIVEMMMWQQGWSDGIRLREQARQEAIQRRAEQEAFAEQMRRSRLATLTVLLTEL